MAGQIIKRGERKYLIRVYLGRDANGKRKYLNKTINGTKRQAQDHLAKLLHQRATGDLYEPSRKALAEYLDEWLAAIRPSIRERTHQDYAGIAERYLKPALGDVPLAELSPPRIQTFYNELSERGLAPRTVRYAHAVLRAALKQAVAWRLIRDNPADTDRVRLPANKRRRPGGFRSPEDAARFLEAARADRWYALWSLLIWTGMRPGEALGLKWEDLTLDGPDPCVRIERALWRKNKTDWRLEPPKTERSVRTVPLPPEAVDALRAHRVRQAEERLRAGPAWQDHGLVFTTETGEPPYWTAIVRRHFEPILNRAGLPPMRAYDLRHSHAAMLLAAGINLKAVSERLGHSNISTTADVYSYVVDGQQRMATERLARLIGGG